MLLALGTFGVIVALVLIPYWLFVLRVEDGATRQLKKRLKVATTKTVRRPDLLQTEKPLSSVQSVQRALETAGFVTNPVRDAIAQAGLEITVGTVILSMAFVAVLAVAILMLVGLPLLVAGFVAAGAGFIPFLVVRTMAGRRTHKFEEQFPEAVELLARSLRAGHAFTTGLAMVAEEMPPPVGAEFKLVHDRQAFGMQLTDALRDMARRVPLIDARFFVTAVLTQRESGGNLSEILDNLARLMRERFTVRREVRTLSAHGRITGWILAALAPAMAAIMFAIAPQHMMVLFTDPMGKSMLAVVLVLQVIGLLVIRRIIDIEV